MKALILAAGFGTRLKPWTDHHPKALVSVGGVPMLERVVVNLNRQGFDDIVVNVHHFSRQIIDFISQRGLSVRISDESGLLLDTGGGIAEAYSFFGDVPMLVHNVDILSDADLGMLMECHERERADATLLVSDRDSSRKLIFDPDMNLKGWHDVKADRYRPEGFSAKVEDREYAFSGIHVVGKNMVEEMRHIMGENKVYPVMDYYLSPFRKGCVKGFMQNGLELIDIGKPATLLQAEDLLKECLRD